MRNAITLRKRKHSVDELTYQTASIHHFHIVLGSFIGPLLLAEKQIHPDVFVGSIKFFAFVKMGQILQCVFRCAV